MLYILNLRLPTEKAHGLQITQNCEAFAAQGLSVTLAASWRFQAPEFRDTDIWQHYGVDKNFNIRFLPSLDLLPFIPHKQLINITLHLQQISFLVSAFFYLLFSRYDIIYTRDHFLSLLARITNPRTQIVYEIHQKRQGRLGRFIQSMAIRVANLAIPITDNLRQSLEREIQPQGNYHVGHDGVQEKRFRNTVPKDTARAQLNIPDGGPIITYAGRLYTLNMDKGVTTMVRAAATIPNARVLIVGGPDGAAAKLRNIWLSLDRKNEDFFTTGQVAPDKIPSYLAASDILSVPFPWNEHFAYFASPMKIFEYMAAERPIIASDLPSIAEVLTHQKTAILVPPSDESALAHAIRNIISDPSNASQLAQNARRLLLDSYTWQKRAEGILSKLT